MGSEKISKVLLLLFLSRPCSNVRLMPGNEKKVLSIPGANYYIAHNEVVVDLDNYSSCSAGILCEHLID